MDLETEELKELVERTLKLSEDTNHVVHKLRRNQVWHTLIGLLWWLGVVGLLGAAYYYYLAPYIEQVLRLYAAL